MPAPQRKLDEFGFPIPPTFAERAVESSPETAKKPRKRFSKRSKITLLGLALVLLVAGPELWKIGRRLLASYDVRQAEQRRLNDDLPGALRALDRAVAWTPDDPQLRLTRGMYRSDANRLRESLEDLDLAATALPRNPQVWMTRSLVYQRLGQPADAVREISRGLDGVQREPASEAAVALMLNQRAYVRAVADVELKEGLTDIQRALGAIPGEPSFLDTRGYLYFRLGDHQAALADLNQAIRAFQYAENGPRFGDRGRFELSPFERRQTREALAVMHHHRGEILEKLGQQDRAKRELQLGDQMGYNPAAGVF